ncbi:MAG TPA: phosphatase PAP2 family protein [Capillimicrobium sp.]|nr:phosphatase PAP2 family protein [Capillimicrobium sp.]
MTTTVRRRDERRDRDAASCPFPLLDARPGSAPERFAQRLGGRHPVAVFLTALIGGFLLLAALSIGLGYLVTQLVLHTGLGADDESFVRTLAQHRTPTETDLSEIGSTVGGAPVLPILAGLIALVSAALRHWRVAAFAVFVLALESATYRVTTLVIHRDRPDVKRLEDLPVDDSFPSGHTAAAIAVYAGLVLLLTSRIRDRAFRALAWTVAIALPVFVALSRMYRGMHHPLDVAGGVIVGLGAIAVLVFACRAAGAAAAARRPALATAGAPGTDRTGRLDRITRDARPSETRPKAAR